MAINTTGPLSYSNIVNEFGGEKPHSLSEYYRGGSRVPNGTINNLIPTSGQISLSNFRGSSNVIVVTYEIIGGGGGGGGGRNDDQGRGYGLYASSGGGSFIRQGASTLVDAPGGRGGFSFAFGWNDSRGAGDSTAYGPGGERGPNNGNGGNAPISSYGAGGGGGGGDRPSTFDSSGNRGEGGLAGIRRVGTLNIIPGSVLSIVIGGAGIGHDTIYDGGNGAAGFARLTFNSQSYDFTSSSSITIS